MRRLFFLVAAVTLLQLCCCHTVASRGLQQTAPIATIARSTINGSDFDCGQVGKDGKPLSACRTCGDLNAIIAACNAYPSCVAFVYDGSCGILKTSAGPTTLREGAIVFVLTERGPGLPAGATLAPPASNVTAIPPAAVPATNVTPPVVATAPSPPPVAPVLPGAVPAANLTPAATAASPPPAPAIPVSPSPILRSPVAPSPAKMISPLPAEVKPSSTSTAGAGGCNDDVQLSLIAKLNTFREQSGAPAIVCAGTLVQEAQQAADTCDLNLDISGAQLSDITDLSCRSYGSSGGGSPTKAIDYWTSQDGSDLVNKNKVGCGWKSQCTGLVQPGEDGSIVVCCFGS